MFISNPFSSVTLSISDVLPLISSLEMNWPTRITVSCQEVKVQCYLMPTLPSLKQLKLLKPLVYDKIRIVIWGQHILHNKYYKRYGGFYC